MAGQMEKRYISHKLSRVDNLVSLALKYGVPVGDLKRENKLWNSDHLFLREHLLIPLTAENENALDEDNDTIVVYNGTTVVKASTSSPSASQPHLPNGSSNSDSLPSSSSSRSAFKKSSRSQSNGSDPDAIESAAEPKTNASEFFNKYDNSIARLKGDVAKLGKNAAAGKSMASEIRVSVSSSISSRSSTSSYHMVNDEIENLNGIIDANPLVLPPRKSSSSSSRRGSNSSTSSASERRGRFLSEEDVNSSPVLMIRSRTNNKQVKTAIENLEQVNDDIFEL
ncbi:lysM and putative peptidoglycan-binding domain-containing protein 2-like isoform X2 [Biomphalaria pfeifferi]|uniref:LysM and putative peptidoglycan-binding domain-containing protein 2-like isoform X2 n=1 Tax=Biomphalaria pfeifferi TaxID=112525 RepID=A0AAD8F9W6_BIOPF|nr:lysM and putative peptidoglycan-binding domain-containing protein 2-like isoform X2 [Biomphalaria pfeifferi]